jgi:hypothetical protein
MRVPLGREGWYLCTGSEEPEPGDVEFRGDQTLAFQLLTQFGSDPMLLVELQRLFQLPFLNSYPDALEQVASNVASGVWRLRRPDWELMPLFISEKVADGAAFPLQERRAPAPSSAPRPDPPSFPPDADLAAIAAIQQEAAELGIPFCEECAKAAAAAGRN